MSNLLATGVAPAPAPIPAPVSLGQQVRDAIRLYMEKGQTLVPPYAGGDLSDDLPLGDRGLGLDSVGVLELCMELGIAFGVDVPDSRDLPLRTVGDLVSAVTDVLAEKHRQADKARLLAEQVRADFEGWDDFGDEGTLVDDDKGG